MINEQSFERVLMWLFFRMNPIKLGQTNCVKPKLNPVLVAKWHANETNEDLPSLFARLDKRPALDRLLMTIALDVNGIILCHRINGIPDKKSMF